MLKRAETAGARTGAQAEEHLRRQERLREALELYERYGKPLEAKHWGAYLAVSRDGRTVLGLDLDEVSREAVDQLGPEHFQFKVGEVAVWKIR